MDENTLTITNVRITDMIDFTVNGECSNCGQCCTRFLPISSKEIKRIHKYIEKHSIVEQTPILPINGYALIATCPFRDATSKRCLIYSVRPEICKHFQCNQSEDVWRTFRDYMHTKYKDVDMREEFF